MSNTWTPRNSALRRYLVAHDRTGKNGPHSREIPAKRASSTDTTDVNNIITNNNFSGPNTVNLSGTYALEISVGCTWYRVNS